MPKKAPDSESDDSGEYEEVAASPPERHRRGSIFINSSRAEPKSLPRRPTSNTAHQKVGQKSHYDEAENTYRRGSQTPARGSLEGIPSSSPLTADSTFSTNRSKRTTSTSTSDHPSSSPVVSPSSDQVRSSQRPSLARELPRLLEDFASIETSKYRECYEFVKDHRSIANEDHNLFLRGAVAALQANQAARANRCVQRAIMIRQCHGSTAHEISTFFEDLIQKKPAPLNDFLTECHQVIARLKDRLPTLAAAQSQQESRQDTDPATPLASISLNRHSVLHEEKERPRDEFPGPTYRRPQDANIGQGKSGALDTPSKRHGGSDVPTMFDSDGRRSDDDILDGRYRIRFPSAPFFIFGRVFVTPWHTALGANSVKALDKWVVTDCFGEKILTHLQRMVVVKEGHGFSWCVPVNTYQGKGVAKKGLKAVDRLAHAILYMRGSDVQETPEEKGMMRKKRIAVDPAGPDQKLDVMSRINFGKVHTVEHNVKVMDVGKISRSSMEYFEEYWDEHR